jgi:hypothetical protein
MYIRTIHAYIHTDVDVELQYPVVALVPSLIEVQEAVNDVVLHCIDATKGISMWGATRKEREREHLMSVAERESRSMHVHVAQDRLILKQLVMLAGGMQVLKDLVTNYIQPFHKYDYLWKTDKASAIEAFCLEARIPYAVMQSDHLSLGLHSASWEGLRMVSFLAGIQESAEKMEDKQVMWRAVLDGIHLDAIHAQMQAQWALHRTST